MKRFLKPFTLRDYIHHSFTIAVSVFLIVYFIPSDSPFRYRFSLDKPWKHNSLIADFDFPVFKDSLTLRAERDSVLKAFKPYYQFDSYTGKEKVKQLQHDFFQLSLAGIPTYYLKYLEQKLHAVYAAGILSSDELKRLSLHGVTDIFSVLGNEATPRAVKNLYSVHTAYEFLLNTDTLHYSREVLRRCNLNNYLEENLHYNAENSAEQYQNLLSSVSEASGLVVSGQKIINRGEIVDANTYRILESYRRENLSKATPGARLSLIALGQTIFCAVLLVFFTIFLYLYRRDYYDRANNTYLLSALVVVFPVITSLLAAGNPLNAYLVPYAMIAIFVRIFMDARTAFISHAITVLLCSCSLHEAAYEFVLIQTVAGLAAIYSLKELSERSQLLRTTLIVTATSLLLGFAYHFMQGGKLMNMDKGWCINVCINGILLLFTYPLMYLVEKIFGFTSSVTLIELSNVNNSLLQRMLKEAQGTFNHSMQVANLVAEIAGNIGARVQLVRTGALYHDIGKMSNPAFFTENQSGINPHDKLSEEQSAQIILSHVTEGQRLAAKHHLPKIIRDFISTHHGTGLTKYFYVNYANKHAGEPVDDAPFRYSGPNPATLEQAILMMADAVEATSRSLKEYSEDSIRALVNNTIDAQISEGYFRNCPITFRDIEIAKSTLIESLKTLYHTRISYPEMQALAPKAGAKTHRKHSFKKIFGSSR